eukprot:scaffold13447_cov59-Attheya_sp.AAC.1
MFLNSTNVIFLPGLWNDGLSHQGSHSPQDPERGQIRLVGSRIPKAHEGPNGCGGSVKDGYLVRLKYVPIAATVTSTRPTDSAVRLAWPWPTGTGYAIIDCRPSLSEAGITSSFLCFWMSTIYRSFYRFVQSESRNKKTVEGRTTTSPQIQSKIEPNLPFSFFASHSVAQTIQSMIL